MKKELAKTKEMRHMLQHADIEGSDTQRRLMNTPDELKSILDHLDADQSTTWEHGKFSDLWFFDRLKKVSTSVDSLISKIVSEDFGHSEISWNNIEQVFNPYVSGVSSLEEQKQRLVAAGMSFDLADELRRQYLSKTA